jgi:hypothetical protein
MRNATAAALASQQLARHESYLATDYAARSCTMQDAITSYATKGV